MKRLFLTLAAVAAMSVAASACPPVQVSRLRLEANYSTALVAEPVYTQALVREVSYPVALALEVNDHCSSAFRLEARARRQPVRNLFRGGRRSNVNVQVGNICH